MKNVIGHEMARLMGPWESLFQSRVVVPFQVRSVTIDLGDGDVGGAVAVVVPSDLAGAGAAFLGARLPVARLGAPRIRQHQKH